MIENLLQFEIALNNGLSITEIRKRIGDKKLIELLTEYRNEIPDDEEKLFYVYENDEFEEYTYETLVELGFSDLIADYQK